MLTKSTSNFKPKLVTKLEASLVAREMYHTRNKSILSRKRQHLLVGRHMQGDAKRQTCLRGMG